MWLADLPDGHRARPLSKELESEQLDLLAMLAGQSSVSRPNGSRLSCGRPARRRKSSGRQSVPARAQHSTSFQAISARQLQAHVRPRAHHAVQLLQLTSPTVRLSLAVSRTATNGGLRESWIVCLTARQSSPGAMLNPSDES